MNLKLKLGKMYILSGLPGSGKSSLLKSVPDTMVVSSDKLREDICGYRLDLDEHGVFKSIPEDSNNAVFSILGMIVEEKCRLGLTVFIDATSLRDSDRAKYVKIAEKHSMDYEVLIFDVSREEAIENNKNREKRVGEYVINSMDVEFERTSVYPYRLVNGETHVSFEENILPDKDLDIIGDVHGLYDDMVKLLEEFGYSVENGVVSHPENRKLLFLGDFIDRGPDSVEVLEFVEKAVSQGHYAILGNHEQKLINNYRTYKEGSEIRGGIAGKITLMQLLKRPERVQERLVKFLARLPYYFVHENENSKKTLFVHGNISYGNTMSISKADAIYGTVKRRSSYKKDTDHAYQVLKDAGHNLYSLIRGHIPQISTQKDVVALEEQQAFGGYMVGAVFNGGEIVEFKRVKCEFNFDEAIDSNLLIGLDNLIMEKLAAKKADVTGNMNIYKYSKKVFFNNLWHKDPLLLKARGLVLDLAGNIVQHPFDKIFNYGENDTGLDIDPEKEVIAVDKYNGFLGNIGLNPFTNKLLVTTTGSFDSDFVGYINDFIDSELNGKLLKFLNKNRMTLSFEVIHPDDPHIIEYEESEMGLVLIGARKLGIEDMSVTEAELDKIGEELGFKRAGWKRVKFGELKKEVETSEIEGFIVRDPECEFETPILKFKTPYYLVTKFIARMVESKVRFMYGNPRKFKESLDEEFYDLVDIIIDRLDMDTFLEMSNEEKTVLVREFISEMRN